MGNQLTKRTMEIAVLRDATIGGKAFSPTDNLVAKATDASGTHWHMMYALSNSACIIALEDLERLKKAGFISF